MPVFLAPIAAAGYMYWKKKKEDEEKSKVENGDDSNDVKENVQEWDMVEKPGSSEGNGDESSLVDSTNEVPSTSTTEVCTEDDVSIEISDEMIDCIENSSMSDIPSVPSEDSHDSSSSQAETPIDGPREDPIPSLPAKPLEEAKATTTPIQKPSHAVRAGPFAKFRTFCENLEKEYEKAEIRRLEQARLSAKGQTNVAVAEVSVPSPPSSTQSGKALPRIAQASV